MTVPFGGAIKRVRSLASSALRGRAHRRRLETIDTRIVVSGTRGKSSMTRRLYDVLRARGYDVGAKITGDRPQFLHDGKAYEVERGSRVTLYENEREIRRHTPEDALVVENQAIGDYTTRVVNEYFIDPDVIVITNVRQDHRDTLGDDRHTIARSLVRAVPEGTHVINGESDPGLREYIEAELTRRNATVTHTTVPDEHTEIPGAEAIYAMNDVLRAVGEPALSPELLAGYIDEMRVEWTALLGGRVYNAAGINDVESTETVRRALTRDDDRGRNGNGSENRDGNGSRGGGEEVCPFVYTRGDRRARTASFLTYLDRLFEEAAFETAHVAGDHAGLFARKASFPVVRHDIERESAAEVLDALLDGTAPVLLMGNTVASFMREMEAEIDRRADKTPSKSEISDSETIGSSGREERS